MSKEITNIQAAREREREVFQGEIFTIVSWQYKWFCLEQRNHKHFSSKSLRERERNRIFKERFCWNHELQWCLLLYMQVSAVACDHQTDWTCRRNERFGRDLLVALTSYNRLVRITILLGTTLYNRSICSSYDLDDIDMSQNTSGDEEWHNH